MVVADNNRILRNSNANCAQRFNAFALLSWLEAVWKIRYIKNKIFGVIGEIDLQSW